MQYKQEADQEKKITVHFSDNCGEDDWWSQISVLSDQKNYSRFKNAAEQGEVHAQRQLAEHYFQGKGVEQDYAEAVKWFLKAAEQGDIFAQMAVADCYYWGHGIGTNYIQAANWYEKAAEQGHVHAQSKLAYCYFNGFGVKEDRTKAVDLYEKAVELELAYAENRYVSESQNLESKLDRVCRASNLKKDAEQNIAYIRNKLADCYFYGFGVKKADPAKAVNQLKIAAELGEDTLAHRRLAICYFFGKEVEKDLRQTEKRLLDSFSILEQQPLKQKARVEAELGIFYYHKKDYARAFNYFTKSSESKDGLGCLWLAYFFKNKSDIAVKLLEESKYSRNISLLKGIGYKYIVAEPLYMASASLFLQDDDNYYYDPDMINYAFPDEVIHFLEHENSSPAKVILAFYYRCKNKYEKYTQYLRQASTKQDILANYLLGKYYKDYKDSENFDKATSYFNKVDKERKLKYSPLDEKKCTVSEYPLNTQQFLVYSAKEELSNIKHQEEIKEKNKQLQEAQIELEDMMSMFAHKFRSPLDAIIYNTTHENQVKLYTEAAQTMRGLLNIFSIISTDAEILKDKIKQDGVGSGRLTTVFSKTLDMILLHLLSVSGAEKIQQHYMAYAKAHGQCDAEVSYKIWCEDYFELEKALQAEWEQSFALLLNQSATLDQRLAWLEQHFFKLELTGFERADIQFKEYGVTESFLTILLNEILVNAFKYYSSTSKQPVVLEWTEREGYQVLICRNPSVRSERTIIKGSHKGHVFLSTLARKTGSIFTKPTPQDNFVVEFGIPDELLISK